MDEDTVPKTADREVPGFDSPLFRQCSRPSGRPLSPGGDSHPAPLAQLADAPGSKPEGWWFESTGEHHVGQ